MAEVCEPMLMSRKPAGGPGSNAVCEVQLRVGSACLSTQLLLSCYGCKNTCGTAALPFACHRCSRLLHGLFLVGIVQILLLEDRAGHVWTSVELQVGVTLGFLCVSVPHSVSCCQKMEEVGFAGQILLQNTTAGFSPNVSKGVLTWFSLGYVLRYSVWPFSKGNAWTLKCASPSAAGHGAHNVMLLCCHIQKHQGHVWGRRAALVLSSIPWSMASTASSCRGAVMHLCGPVRQGCPPASLHSSSSSGLQIPELCFTPGSVL